MILRNLLKDLLMAAGDIDEEVVVRVITREPEGDSIISEKTKMYKVARISYGPDSIITCEASTETIGDPVL
jgi:hypothetical protein